MIPDPVEDANEEPAEDDGIGIPDVIEVVTEAEVDEAGEDDGSTPTHEGEPE